MKFSTFIRMEAIKVLAENNEYLKLTALQKDWNWKEEKLEEVDREMREAHGWHWKSEGRKALEVAKKKLEDVTKKYDKIVEKGKLLPRSLVEKREKLEQEIRYWERAFQIVEDAEKAYEAFNAKGGSQRISEIQAETAHQILRENASNPIVAREIREIMRWAGYYTTGNYNEPEDEKVLRVAKMIIDRSKQLNQYRNNRQSDVDAAVEAVQEELSHWTKDLKEKADKTREEVNNQDIAQKIEEEKWNKEADREEDKEAIDKYSPAKLKEKTEEVEGNLREGVTLEKEETLEEEVYDKMPDTDEDELQ